MGEKARLKLGMKGSLPDVLSEILKVGVSPGGKCCLVALAVAGDVGLETAALADAAGMSLRHCRSMVRALHDAGLIEGAASGVDKHRRNGCREGLRPAETTPENPGAPVLVMSLENGIQRPSIEPGVPDKVGKQDPGSSSVERPSARRTDRGRTKRPPKPEQVKGIRGSLMDLASKHPTLNVEAEFEQWQDWMAAKGRRFENYAAAFRNWLRKSEKGIYPRTGTRASNWKRVYYEMGEE